MFFIRIFNTGIVCYNYISEFMGGCAMRKYSNFWSILREHITKTLFLGAYSKEVLPKRVKIEVNVNLFGAGCFPISKAIEYCLDIGWEKASWEEMDDNENMFLVLERRAQKRYSPG